VRIDAGTLKLHCVPIVNVFRTGAVPLSISAERQEYPLRPDGLAPAHGDVFAITSATGILRGGARVPVLPFFGYEAADRASSGRTYVVHHRPSNVAEGSDSHISFWRPRDRAPVDLDVVSIDLLATNRSLPQALRAGDVRVATQTSPAFATFRNLRSPTAYVPVRTSNDLHWRLVAHAGLGLGSLARVATLRALLTIEDPRAEVDAQAARSRDLRVASLREVIQRPEERVYRGSLVRGVAIEIVLDDRGFSGPGEAFVFGGVLDRLFASAAPLNVFTRTTVTLMPSNERFGWPARAGGRPLL
jgi:type VI secretion system protein ImpG